MYDSLYNPSRSIIKIGIKDGQDQKEAADHTNYAVYETPLEKMYSKNVTWLRMIKKYDPFRIMGLTGRSQF